MFRAATPGPHPRKRHTYAHSVPINKSILQQQLSGGKPNTRKHRYDGGEAEAAGGAGSAVAAAGDGRTAVAVPLLIGTSMSTFTELSCTELGDALPELAPLGGADDAASL